MTYVMIHLQCREEINEKLDIPFTILFENGVIVHFILEILIYQSINQSINSLTSVSQPTSWEHRGQRHLIVTSLFAKGSDQTKKGIPY